jgi:hypothetical protein
MGALLRRVLACGLAVLCCTLLTGAVVPAPPPADPTSGVDPAALPSTARELLPLISELTASRCPELPPLWVVAQVQAESGWDERLAGPAPGGPAGLYQLNQQNWLAAGGAPWPADPPGPGSDVTSGAAHLRIALPWVCATLQAVSAHLERTGKPTPALDAMLVCHVAGCGRVTGSATGVPAPGEAGCTEPCARVIARYLAAVHANLMRFALPPVPPPAAAPAPAPDTGPPPDSGPPTAGPQGPMPWTGGATRCRPPDPTGSGCVTGATRHGLLAAAAAFGGWSAGPVIRSAGCWNSHAWNPRSDHPRGRACDLFATAPGRFAGGAELAAGWRLADWLRAGAGPLRVRYLIWQGRYWAPGVADQDGWGRRYTGGGVYDVRDPTGGHYDHVHVSFRE